jgi:outer membrane protein
MRTLIAAAFVCASAALVLPAQADESTNTVNLVSPFDPAGEVTNPWFFRLGAAELQNMDGIKLTLGGQPYPGAALHYDHIYSGLLEVGYTFLPGLSGVLSVGWPPAISIGGGGTLAPAGKLESTTFGPSALTVQYQPFQTGFFRPYVGAGASYMIVFSTHNGTIQSPKLTNDLAPELEAGSDFMLQENLGFFIEVKKAFLTTHATGNFPGAPGVAYPISGHVGLDPWVYGTGVRFSF